MPVSRLLLRLDDDRFDAIDIADIYFAEARDGDTMVRTRRKRVYSTTERIGEFAARLPKATFVRVHRSYLVNLDRVRQVRRRGGKDWELALDPPVNAVIPVARGRVAELFRKLGWKGER